MEVLASRARAAIRSRTSGYTRMQNLRSKDPKQIRSYLVRQSWAQAIFGFRASAIHRKVSLSENDSTGEDEIPFFLTCLGSADDVRYDTKGKLLPNVKMYENV